LDGIKNGEEIEYQKEKTIELKKAWSLSLERERDCHELAALDL